jgi:tRNA(fMet)-specific endonuclease VapC
LIILDTDCVTLLTRGGVEGNRLRALLSDQDPINVATTIVTYEEQTRGWMSLVARAKSMSQQIEAYRVLARWI